MQRHVKLAVRTVPVLALILAATLGGCGCGPTPGPVEPEPPPEPVDEAALSIPVGVGTDAALAALARAGTPAAAWQRTHYLIELFDDARFRRDDASLAALRGAMGVTGAAARARSPEITAEVAAWLTAAVAALPPGASSPGDLDAARTLIGFDTAPPLRLADVDARLAPLRAIAQSGGALADAARLRLAGWCRRGLEDALEADDTVRPGRAAHCLWAVTRIDATPWIGGAPPAIPWDAIRKGIGDVLDDAVDGGRRLSLAATSERRTMLQLVGILAGDAP